MQVISNIISSIFVNVNIAFVAQMDNFGKYSIERNLHNFGLDDIEDTYFTIKLNRKNIKERESKVA